MKKLLSIAFLMVSMMFVASSADAQTRNNQNNRSDQRNDQRNDRRNDRRYEQNDKKVVRTYTETKNVWIRGRQYVETYQIQIFRNGVTNSKLISRVEVKNRRGNNRYDDGKVSYKTSTIWENGRKYKVTYKITKLRNGHTKSEIIKKVRV